jgi:GDP-L-fucose synthase
LFLLENYDGDMTINVGAGKDLTIAELAELIREIVHPEAEIVYDRSMPDGMPRKLLDVSRLHALGWTHRIGLREGIAQTYQHFAARADRLGA